MYAFDAYGSDTGEPGGLPDGPRYWLAQDGYSSPVRHSDMTLAPGFAGMHAQRADLLFFVGDPGEPFVNVDFYYTLLTVEDDLDLTCNAPTTIYDGIQINFAPADGAYYANIDVTSDPTLFWTLPKDGSGGYMVLLTQDPAGTVLAIGHTGLWFTGEDQTPPEPRAGTNNPAEASDDTASTCGGLQPNGVIEYGCECYDFTVNVPEGSNLTTSVAFGVDVASCQADCDGDGSLSIDDFICFQTLFAIGEPSADCDGSGTLDIDDFICFQTIYAVGC